MEIYTLPYNDQYIVYRPLLRLAFAANAALVNWIAAMGEPASKALEDTTSDCHRFLDSIGFFQPDPPPPEAGDSMTSWQPDTAVLCLTNQCNLRCVYCYASAGERNPKTLSPVIGTKVIDVICQNALRAGKDAFAISFHGGGEPTMASGLLCELAAYAHAKPLPVNLSLTTNGCWSSAVTERILALINEFTISCDGLPLVQNDQRPTVSGKGSFSNVMTTIRALDRADSRYGMRLTITNRSISHLTESIRFFCRESDCRVFQVEPAFSQGRADRCKTVLSQFEPFITAFLEAYDIAASYGRHLYYSGARPWLITNMFCRSPHSSIVVTPDGEISTCFEVIDAIHPLHQTFCMGRITTETAGIGDHPARHRLLADIETRRQQCRGCFCYWHCAGDCPAKRLTADPLSGGGGDSRCHLNRTLTRELLLRYMAANGGIWAGARDPL